MTMRKTKTITVIMSTTIDVSDNDNENENVSNNDILINSVHGQYLPLFVLPFN